MTQNNDASSEDNQEWYDMSIHHCMLQDQSRMCIYYKFIRQNKYLKNKICCDIGAGTGILSLFALLAGVKFIFIVENQRNMINTIYRLLDSHHISRKRYKIIQGWTTNVTLPVKVDCIIHELIGMWGNAEQC